MKRWLLGPVLALCAAWLATCETAPPPPSDDDGPRTRLVQVASNGWHTAIVVPAPALAATGLLPEAADFPGRRVSRIRLGGSHLLPGEGEDARHDPRRRAGPDPGGHAHGRAVPTHWRSGVSVLEVVHCWR